jgi:hypothetical protein
MAGKKVRHILNVSVKKALITHLDFDVTQKGWLIFFAGHCTVASNKFWSSRSFFDAIENVPL